MALVVGALLIWLIRSSDTKPGARRKEMDAGGAAPSRGMLRSALLVEVFQIDRRQVPKLHGYELDVAGGPATAVGGRLCYRLSKVLGGHWVWTTGRAVTDAPKDLAEIEKVVNR